MKKLILFALAIAVSSLHATEHWWEIRLADQPTGFLRSGDERIETGNTRTIEEMLFAMNRLGTRVEIETSTQTVEDPAGLMVSLTSETTTSQQTIAFEAVRKESEIELRTTAGDKSYTQLMPVTGPVYGPEGVARLVREKLRAAHDAVTYQMFLPDMGRVAKFTRTVLAEENLNGQPVLKVQEESDAMPDKPVSWFDHEGRMVRAERDMPFGKMVMRVTDRESALRASKGSELGAESYARTLARSNVRLPDPRSIERILLKLTHRRPDLGWPAFEGPHQRVVDKTANTVVLEVTQPITGAASHHVEETQYLQPNAILQSDDAEVARLAHSIVGEERDRFRAARKLQEWVANHLKLDLGITLAPASEVARNRRGTCIAYSILLASLERAAAIPSRVAEGYVYVDGIWGGHAWTEVLTGGQWIPLDAAVYRAGPADAARFQFGSYTLQDNLAAANQAGLQMYGNIDVAVIDYTIHGRTVHVPDSAQSYQIADDRYQNPWLGISVRKPRGFGFTRLDEVYPDATIVGMENGAATMAVTQEPVGTDPENSVNRRLDEIAPSAMVQRVSLDGRPALLVASPTKARLVARDGASLWVVTAEGQAPQHWLEQVMGGWKWMPAE
jgi:transglutaminase-like putative cysteine protease